jgi:hypothetical protein
MIIGFHTKLHFTISENVSKTFKYKECDQNCSWARLIKNALFKKPKTSHLKGCIMMYAGNG